MLVYFNTPIYVKRMKLHFGVFFPATIQIPKLLHDSSAGDGVNIPDKPIRLEIINSQHLLSLLIGCRELILIIRE